MLSGRILHIAKDEKFIDNAFWQFDQVGAYDQTFVILLNRGNSQCKYVKNTSKRLIKVISDKTFNELSELINQSDLVVLYGLDFFVSRLVLKNKANYLWMFLGGEIYNNPYGLLDKVYGEKTKRIVLKEESFKIENSIVKPILRKLKYGFSSHKRTIVEAAKSIQYLGVVHQEDYQLLKENKLISPSVKHFEFAFYPLEFIFKDNEETLVNADNILLGNSSSKTNNHLEALDVLSQLNLEDRKVITPLSYGNIEYLGLISKKGKDVLGANFTPLTDFISLEEYNKLIQGCGIVVMNHYRQQAMGNIIASLWMGAKVYLDERNTIYSYLKRIGLHVFSISNDLTCRNQEVFSLLNEQQIKENREILIKELGVKSLLLKLETQLKSII